MTQETINQIIKFRDDREWKQFHNPKDLAISISLEASELLEVFQWSGADTSSKNKIEKIKEELADVVIVTSDNPRSEEPQQIITDILTGLKSVNEVIVEPDRELAIKEAHKIARENDVVLIAGKGHEDYQEIEGVKHHFDDKEEVEKLFAEERI